MLAPLRRDDAPFSPTPKLPATRCSCEPSLVAEVEFREWTSDGVMRAPSFKGLRDDKDAVTVVREGPEARAVGAAAAPGEAVQVADPRAAESLFEAVERLPDGALAVVADGRRAEDHQLGQGPVPARPASPRAT